MTESRPTPTKSVCPPQAVTQKQAGCEELVVALEQKECGHELGKEIVVQ